MRKAITIPFFMIFVIIAGSIILLFFFSLAQRARTTSEIKLDLALIRTMETMYVGALQSIATAQNFSVVKKIAFSCSDFPACNCLSKIGKAAVEFKEKVIFAESLIEPPKGIFWSLDWNAPFRATNFLYVTDINYHYIFVYDKNDSISLELKKIINKTMPELISFEFVEKENAIKLNYKDRPKVKIVFLQTKPFALPKGVKGVVINETLPITEGDVAIIFGSIFSGDQNIYDCGISKAAERLEKVSKVYSKALEGINVPSECLGLIESAISVLGNLAEKAKEVKRDAAVEKIKPLISDLNQTNWNLIYAGCPQIY